MAQNVSSHAAQNGAHPPGAGVGATPAPDTAPRDASPATAAVFAAAAGSPSADAETARPGRGLRILHVVRQYAPSAGGLETYVAQLIAHQRHHHRVHVLTLNKVFGRADQLAARTRLGGAAIHRVGFRGTRQFFTPFTPLGWLKRFDVIHVHCTDQLLDRVRLARMTGGPPYVVTSHGLFFHTESLRRVKEVYLRLITRGSLNRAHRVLAISDNDAQIMRGVGVDSEMMRNPIEPFSEPLASGRDLVYIGRLSVNKRVERLIDFMSHVRAVDPSAHLHIVGGDPEGLADGLIQRAAEKGVTDAITFHGYIPREHIEAVCARGAYVISASRYEGFGIAVIEGMSKGLIPVVHDNAAFRETVELARVGLVTDFDDPAIAAREFLAWRAAPASAERAQARRFALSHSWSHVVARLDEIYADAVAHG